MSKMSVSLKNSRISCSCFLASVKVVATSWWLVSVIILYSIVVIGGRKFGWFVINSFDELLLSMFTAFFAL